MEQLVQERQKRGDAFKGEALGSQVARLDDRLENVGAREQVKHVPLRIAVERGRSCLEALGEPVAAVSEGDVHELGADGGSVDAAGVVCVGTDEIELGDAHGREVLVERVELGLQIAPAAEGVENGDPLRGLFAL